MEKVFYETRPKGRVKEYERWTLVTEASETRVKHEVIVYNETLALEPFVSVTNTYDLEDFLSAEANSGAKDELLKILAEMKKKKPPAST